MIRTSSHSVSIHRTSPIVLLVAVFALSIMYSPYSEAKEDCSELSILTKEYWECIYNNLYEDYLKLKGELKDVEGQLAAPVRIADDLANIIDQSALDMLGLDTNTLMRLNEAIEFINGQNEALLDEFETFAQNKNCTGVCADFRSRLGGLIRQAGRVTNLSSELLVMQRDLDGGFRSPWTPPSIDANKMADFIENAPPTMLFPLYYALNKVVPGNTAGLHSLQLSSSGCYENYCQFFNPLENIIDGIDSRLKDLRGILVSMNTPAIRQVSYAPSLTASIAPPRNLLCKALFIDPSVPDQMGSITSYIALGSKVLYMVGDFFTKAKITVVEGEDWAGLDFGVEAQLSAKRRPGAMFGAVVKLLTGPTRMIAEGLETKVSDCRQRLEQHLAICALANDVKQNSTFEDCKQEVLVYDASYGF